MKLISFQIKGFKSIIDTGICKISELDNITVLAGQNEAGKSAVLEALDFFKNGPGTDFVRLQKRMDSQTTEVICGFILSEEDIKEILNNISDNEARPLLNAPKNVTLMRTWTEGGNAKGDLLISEDYFDFLQDQMSEDINPAEGQNTNENEERIEQTEDETQAVTTTTTSSNPSPSTSPSDSKSIESIKKIISERIIAKLPIITLYRYFADFLPSEIEISSIQTNPAVKDFEKVFGVNLTQIANISDSRQLEKTVEDLSNNATDDFNESWSQQLSITDETKYTFVIRINQQEPKKAIFMIKGTDNNPLYLEQKSMGFRWFSAFHLRLRALGSAENLSNLILLVDEPGQNLHEKAQLDAKKVLEELSDKGAQIIYSTHNAKLIGIEGKEFARIRLVSNSKDIGTKVETVSQFSSRPDNGSIDALSPIITAMGMSSIGPFVDRERFNVAVEGISDHYYMNAFLKLLGKNENLYFVPACGVNNVPNIVSVLIGWGFKYKAVFDDDAQGGRKAYQLLKKEFYENDDKVAHDHILKVKGCYGIEDIFSKTDFHKFVLDPSQKFDKKKSNSELSEGKKEILAKQFLEKVNNGEKIELDDETTKKIEEVFSWIDEKFGATS